MDNSRRGTKETKEVKLFTTDEHRQDTLGELLQARWPSARPPLSLGKGGDEEIFVALAPLLGEERGWGEVEKGSKLIRQQYRIDIQGNNGSTVNWRLQSLDVLTGA